MPKDTNDFDLAHLLNKPGSEESGDGQNFSNVTDNIASKISTDAGKAIFGDLREPDGVK